MKPDSGELYRPSSRFLIHKGKGDLDMILQVLYVVNNIGAKGGLSLPYF